MQLRNFSTRWQVVLDTGMISASGIDIFNTHFHLKKIFVMVLNCDIYIQIENGF